MESGHLDRHFFCLTSMNLSCMLLCSLFHISNKPKPPPKKPPANQTKNKPNQTPKNLKTPQETNKIPHKNTLKGRKYSSKAILLKRLSSSTALYLKILLIIVTAVSAQCKTQSNSIQLDFYICRITQLTLLERD